MKRWRFWLSIVVLSALIVVGAALASLVALVGRANGEWSLPLHVAGTTLSVPAYFAIQLATSEFGPALLDGRRFNTRYGTITLHNAPNGMLQLRCAPCSFSAKAFGTALLTFSHLEVGVRRHGNLLVGDIAADGMIASWQGVLSERGLELSGEIAPVPLSSVYALFRSQIPELEYAQIEGNLSGRAGLSLPAGHWQVDPRLSIDRVDGLGTPALRGQSPTPTCAKAGGTSNRWLNAAVIAAEDQRFYEHHGFDATELAESLNLNAHTNRDVRGASTITQQLAKLIYTGSDRTLARKLRELLYAVEMERTLGKNQVLQVYLAIAPWGDGICGSEAAAWQYFGKPVSKLRLAEAAWLASLLRNPKFAQSDPVKVKAHAEKIIAWMPRLGKVRREKALADLHASDFSKQM